MFENRVLKIIFGLKRDEVTGDLRKLHNVQLNDLYCSPIIVRVIKSRRMRWAGHVSRMGERRGIYRIWWENLRERDHLGDSGIEGRIILRWIFWKWYGDMDWIKLAQDRDRWWEFVNVVMSLQGPQNTGNFLTS